MVANIMLALHCKKTEAIDLKSPIWEYISNTYSVDQVRHSACHTTLQTCSRTTLRGPVQFAGGRSLAQACAITAFSCAHDSVAMLCSNVELLFNTNDGGYRSPRYVSSAITLLLFCAGTRCAGGPWRQSRRSTSSALRHFAVAKTKHASITQYRRQFRFCGM